MLDFYQAAMIEANQDEAQDQHANYTPTGSTLETMDCPALPFFAYRHKRQDGKVIKELIGRACDFDNACQLVEEDREECRRPTHYHSVTKGKILWKYWA